MLTSGDGFTLVAMASTLVAMASNLWVIFETCSMKQAWTLLLKIWAGFARFIVKTHAVDFGSYSSNLWSLVSIETFGCNVVIMHFVSFCVGYCKRCRGFVGWLFLLLEFGVVEKVVVQIRSCCHCLHESSLPVFDSSIPLQFLGMQ